MKNPPGIHHLSTHGFFLDSRFDLLYSPDNPDVGPGLTLWEGVFEKAPANWLRRCDKNGDVILSGPERAEQDKQEADRADLRAERMAERLRAMGVDPETIQAFGSAYTSRASVGRSEAQCHEVRAIPWKQPGPRGGFNPRDAPGVDGRRLDVDGPVNLFPAKAKRSLPGSLARAWTRPREMKETAHPTGRIPFPPPVFSIYPRRSESRPGGAGRFPQLSAAPFLA